MTDAVGTPPVFRRAMVLMTLSSLLVPVTGLLTAPILAQALGAEGRGEVAAALAPGALMLSVATLGLPEALTYYLAKYPRATRVSILSSSLVAVALGAISFVLVLAALPFLSAGSAELADLIVLATALVVPALVVGMIRAAATGRQMWVTLAVERLVSSLLRIVGLGVLFLLGELTVLNAVLVTSIAPVITVVLYARVFANPPDSAPSARFPGSVPRALIGFGSRVWIGAVAGMLYGRLSQIIMAPLSDLTELGLYVVAITISDVPLVVAGAIQGALFGVNSQSRNAGQVTLTSRVSLLIGATGCLVLGATLPLWIGPVFGQEFQDALVPTWLLLIASVIAVPGFMAAAGLGAWGRPGLRSAGLFLTLAVNVPLFILLVPVSGAVGAAWAGIAGNVVMTLFNMLTAANVMHVSPWDFVSIRAADVRLAWREAGRLTKRRRT